ncbi:hypothetical protein PT502_11285 [Aliarcobacter butzleri]|uniref:hypothetical protein n=1 Tax=Aliarcobacter butzleri TaxID=28197 RepID=UPI0024DE80F0|nr:hypothetical protein [Aliarcobacter butzleri]MDK2084377.1 hypothetical protein [Aliarcobacter butzleri]
MKSILKTVKQLETTHEVLEYIENVISKIKDSEFTKNILDIDNDEWAKQVRIKAYGISWYLNKYINSQEYYNFVYFIENEFNYKQIVK